MHQKFTLSLTISLRNGSRWRPPENELVMLRRFCRDYMDVVEECFWDRVLSVCALYRPGE